MIHWFVSPERESILTNADSSQNWPQYWKLLVLTCVCCSGLMVAFCAAGIIPGFFDIVRCGFALKAVIELISERPGRSVQCIDQPSLLSRLRERALVGSRTNHLGTTV